MAGMFVSKFVGKKKNSNVQFRSVLINESKMTQKERNLAVIAQELERDYSKISFSRSNLAWNQKLHGYYGDIFIKWEIGSDVDKIIHDYYFEYIQSQMSLEQKDELK